MRLACALIAVALTQTGCSALVAASGKDLGELTAREQVHDTFGPPLTVAESSGGETKETFVTRRKIAEGWKGMGVVMIDTLTLGLGELYLLPREGFIAARRSVVGQRLEVQYDDLGRVLLIRSDGEVVFGTRHDYSPPREPPPPPFIPGSAARLMVTGTARFQQTALGNSP